MAKRVYQRVTPETRREILRFSASGLCGREIAQIVGRPKSTVCLVVAVAGGVARREMLEVVPGRLSLDDRIVIYVGVRERRTKTSIASEIGVHPSTVGREIERHGGAQRYRAVAAHLAAEKNRSRPKPCKLADPELARNVIEMLQDLFSPEQISARLKLLFPNEPEKWVSHETIYKSLYVQGRGELRRELAACLRSGRAQRRPRSRIDRPRIKDMVPISERPAEVEDRAVVGHWEGDLIIGAGGRSAIGTLVERSTRFLLLLHLPGRHDATSVREEMTRVIKTLPEAVRRTLTWDRGTEMAEHTQFKIDTDVEVYFCDPYKPWQRGSNENTNGLLRQYFPKGTDLSIYSRSDLDEVQNSMNRRPRKTLGFMTPSEVLAPLLAPTG